MRTKLLIFITVLFLLFISFLYQKNSLSFHFVDEEDNIVLGSYILKGEKLYSDLFSHHQPMAYIISAGVQKATDSNTLFLLIKRHREAVIAWSFVWVVLLVLKFRLLMLFTFLIYEPLKFFLLGHLFLSESLVVYPFVYILGWVFLAKNFFFRWEALFLGFCFSLSFLLLSTLWPVLLVLAFLILRNLRGLWNLGLLGIWGGLLPIILTLSFISLPDYFYNAFYVNFKYYIPATSGPMLSNLINAFFSPIISLTFWEGRSATLQVIQVLTLALFINWIILLKQKSWKIVLLMVTLLGLTNLRYVIPGQQAYSGFHILPWFTALILLTCISTGMVWRKNPNYLVKTSIVILFLISLFITFKESKNTLFQKRDLNKDFYINYSRQADMGQAIRIMKNDGETLFVAPDEWLVYWQADIPHFSKMVNYYAWMAEVPEIRKPLYQKFSQKPPTYFYCDGCEKGYFGLEQFFPQYRYLKKDGKETRLMVLKNKLEGLTKEQRDQLNYYNFTLK